MKSFSLIESFIIKPLSLIFCSVLFLLPTQNVLAQTTEALGCSAEYQIVQTFANSAKWEMCWEPRAGYGYRITQVIYTPPHGIRRKVLGSTHLAQLFVPYDENGARYRDISFGKNLEVLVADECPKGKLLTNSTLCLVRRPTGYFYKNVAMGMSDQGDSFAIYGYIAFSSYKYVLQYTFYDDGSIEPSVGATGSLARFAGTTKTGWPVGDQISVSHNHLLIWRMDFDLDGNANNTVERVGFTNTGGDGRKMVTTPLTVETKEVNGIENSAFWRVINTAQKNADGRSISYEIEPSVTDLLRAPEDFTQNDFYLTQFKTDEELVDKGLVRYVNGEVITDPVLWYGVNFHHTPRAEDDIKMPVHWQGFRIRPRDVTTTKAVISNFPPVITNPGNQTNTANSNVNLQIKATDANIGDALLYSASGLPTGLSINARNGLISGRAPPVGGIYTSKVTVDDGHSGGVVSANFLWTINAVLPNSPPVIFNPGAQLTNVNSNVSLQIKATDSNVGDALVYSAIDLPAGLKINSSTGFISGITTATVGSYIVKVTVSDGHSDGVTNISFPWTIIPGGVSQTFTSLNKIIIPNKGTSTPYPVNVNVNGMMGSVGKITLTLNGLTHSYPADLDILLVGPRGQKSLLMSDSGGDKDVNDITLTFDTASTVQLPQNRVISSGVYRPTDYDSAGPVDNFPFAGAAGPYTADLNVFKGTSPNGIWKVYVFDDVGGDLGKISNGVSLTITTYSGR